MIEVMAMTNISRKYRFLLIIITPIFFSGCATQAMMLSVMTPYQGKHIDSIINVMGYPENERNITGRKILTWNVGQSGTYYLPKTETVSIYGTGGSATGTITGSQAHSYNYHCRLDVVVNDNMIVQTLSYQGNNGGCDMLHSSLKQGVPGGGLSFWGSMFGND
tara:strand:- start:99 stop:587 length:489 start_codon:yes stop_codon:yes gene_type:complete